MVFVTEGTRVLLEPRDSILGELTLDQILAELPEFRRAFMAYEPQKGAVKMLASYEKPVKVLIFFGSWCPHCEKTVPLLSKVLHQISNSQFEPHFYAVPRKISEGPIARQYKVDAVPTVILIGEDGTELKRLSGEELLNPETVLSAALFFGGG